MFSFGGAKERERSSNSRRKSRRQEGGSGFFAAATVGCLSTHRQRVSCGTGNAHTQGRATRTPPKSTQPEAGGQEKGNGGMPGGTKQKDKNEE